MKTSPLPMAEAGQLRPVIAALSRVVEARSPDPVLRSVKVAPAGRGKILPVGWRRFFKNPMKRWLSILASKHPKYI